MMAYDSIFCMKIFAKLQDKAIIADPMDNVATARVEIGADVVLSCDDGENITVHKIALERVAKGEPVFKYGHRIGIAISDIDTGDLVHVHNLSGERGRNN